MPAPLWKGQLDKILAAPIGLLPEQPKPAFWLDPLDRDVAAKTAQYINAGESAAIVVPHLTGIGLALVARALAVATVGRPPIIIHTADLSFPRIYKRLTMHTVGKFASIYPLVRPQLAAMTPPQFLVHTTSVEEILDCRPASACVVDARRLRTPSTVQPAYDATVARGLVCVFLLAAPWWGSVTWLREKGLETWIEGTHETALCGHVPDSMTPYYRRTENYSHGIDVVPETVPMDCEALRTLERSVQTLRGVALTQGGAWPVALHYAEEINHLVQDAVVPISLLKTAADRQGHIWLDGYLRAIEASLAKDLPIAFRPATWGFVRAAQDVLAFLRETHPPKVEWFKERLLRAGNSVPLHVLCRKELERSAMHDWIREEHGLARVELHTPAELSQGGIDSDLLVVSPPDGRLAQSLLGGAAPALHVLAYPWQARQWNGFRRKARQIAPKEIPAIGGAESDEEEPDAAERSFDFQPPPPFLEEDDEAAIRRALDLPTTLAIVIVKTDKGDFSYRDNSLVPTLEVDKFADRPVGLLVPGDTIMVRTDGNIVDAMKTVDGLAETSPLFEEAARKAGAWRSLLLAKIKAESKSYRQIHRDLFPREEVSYAAVRQWIVDPHRLAPNNANLITLLTKLGLDREAAIEVREDVRRYRSYRRRAYNAIYAQWRKHSARLYGISDDLVSQLEDDETVDPELGISLLTLENLVTFAKVTTRPETTEKVTSG